LEQAWDQFERQYQKLAIRAKAFASRQENGAYYELQARLSSGLEGHPLNGLCDEVLFPLREYAHQMTRLASIPKLLKVGVRGSVEKELLGIRERAQLLANIQNSGAAERLLQFSPRAWVRGSFLDFADELLQAWQREVAAGREGELKDAHRLTVEALKAAGLELVPIELNRTQFDPSVHRGRATEFNGALPDGVIVGILKNGFRETGTGRVLIQPEVTVNRVS
jgi:hypothetical protein